MIAAAPPLLSAAVVLAILIGAGWIWGLVWIAGGAPKMRRKRPF